MAFVEGKAYEGYQAPAIMQALEKESGIPRERWPHKRTIQRIVREVATLDRTEPWSLGDATADEAPLILPVLRAYLNIRTMSGPIEGQPYRPPKPYITRAEAKWILRVRRAAPDLGVIDVYRLARAYLAREAHNQPTYDLDALLAFTPWNEDPHPGPFGSVHTMKEVYQRGVSEGWIPPAPPFFMRVLAGIKCWPKGQKALDTFCRAMYAHQPDAYEEAAVLEQSDDEAPQPE